MHFNEVGIVFSPEQILNLTRETRRILPSVPLSVTVPHALSLQDQVRLAELHKQEGVNAIQTEGRKCSNLSSGLSAVTVPMAITAGASVVGVGSAINKLNDGVAMIAEVENIADSMNSISNQNRRRFYREKSLDA